MPQREDQRCERQAMERQRTSARSLWADVSQAGCGKTASGRKDYRKIMGTLREDCGKTTGRQREKRTLR